MPRYTNDPIIEGVRFGTSLAVEELRAAVERGEVRVETLVMTEGHRLDTLAGILLEDAKLWWVIAGLSGIGWGLQVPPGTRIIYPVSKSEIESYT